MRRGSGRDAQNSRCGANLARRARAASRAHRGAADRSRSRRRAAGPIAARAEEATRSSRRFPRLDGTVSGSYVASFVSPKGNTTTTERASAGENRDLRVAGLDAVRADRRRPPADRLEVSAGDAGLVVSPEPMGDSASSNARRTSSGRLATAASRRSYAPSRSPPCFSTVASARCALGVVRQELDDRGVGAARAVALAELRVEVAEEPHDDEVVRVPLAPGFRLGQRAFEVAGSHERAHQREPLRAIARALAHGLPERGDLGGRRLLRTRFRLAVEKRERERGPRLRAFRRRRCAGRCGGRHQHGAREKAQAPSGRATPRQFPNPPRRMTAARVLRRARASALPRRGGQHSGAEGGARAKGRVGGDTRARPEGTRPGEVGRCQLSQRSFQVRTPSGWTRRRRGRRSSWRIVPASSRMAKR